MEKARTNIYRQRLRSFKAVVVPSSARCIQRNFRRFLRHRPRNKVDPITLCSLNECSTIFKLIDEYGCITGFDALALMQYILTSGNINNPLTRKNLSMPEISRLQNLVRKLGIDTKLKLLIPQLERQRKERIEHQSMIDFMENELGNAVTHAIDMSEINQDYNYYEARAVVLNETFPEISSVFFQMYTVCQEETVQEIVNRIDSIVLTHQRLQRYDGIVLQLILNCIENAHMTQRSFVQNV